MRDLIIFGLLSGGIAALVTGLTVPLVSRVALALRVVDYPGGRKEHTGAIPRLGGVSVALGLALGPGAVAVARWGDWGANKVAKADLLALLGALTLVFLVGLVDDVLGLPVWKKFLGQTAAALILVGMGWRIDHIYLPGIGSVQLGYLGAILTVVWIVGLTNAINLIDGLDGLASGVIAIIAASLCLYSAYLGNFLTMILMAGVTGACLGFLHHNWKGTIFLGDAGSLSLGFLLAVMTLHGSMKSSTAVAVLVPVLALGIPATDTLLVMLVRFLGRPKSRLADRLLGMFKADRNHLHHLLQDWAGDRRSVVLVLYGLIVLSCVAALVVAVKENWVIGLVLVGVELGAVVAVRRLGLSARLKASAAEARRAIRERIARGEAPLPNGDQRGSP